jgi:hypothetical protein
MPKHYVTFGQVHTHRVAGKTVDCDCVAVYEAESAAEGRDKAFFHFGPKFFTDYHDTEWKEEDLHYFPNGYVELKI